MRKINRKRFTYLLLILFVVSILFVFKNNYQKITNQKSPHIFSNLKEELIKEIELKSENQKIHLYKKNNQWFLKKNNIEYKADQEKINQILTAFVNLKKTEIVSTNPRKFKNFGIDKQQITLINSNKKYQIFIGNNFSLDKNYLKIEKDNEVFIGEGFNNFSLSDDFRDLKVYLINEEEMVDFIEINHSGLKLTFTKKSQDWYLNNKKIKKEKIDFLINDLATLKASDIMPKEIETPLVSPLLQIKIKEKNKITVGYFIKKDDQSYYLRIPQKEYLYVIPEYLFSSFNKEEKDFQD